MTDNEIIKALEWLERLKRDTDVSEWAESLKIILNEYKRQKAEIERLNIESETLATQLKGAYEQIHKLNMAASEAKNEFAEELEDFILNEDIEVVKPKCKDYESYINGANQFRHQIKNGINKLVKKTE